MVILQLVAILVLWSKALPRGNEDVIVINKPGVYVMEKRAFKEELTEDYVKRFGPSDGIHLKADFEEMFLAEGFETASHFYNLLPDDNGAFSQIRDEGFRFLRDGDQELLVVFSREGMPIHRTQTSQMYVELSRISQVPMTIMGGIYAAKEERYQVFIRDYKGMYVLIRTFQITEEELIPIIQTVIEGIAGETEIASTN